MRPSRPRSTSSPQALANFKSQVRRLSPEPRLLAGERGLLASSATRPLSVSTYDPTSPGTGDITVGQLAQRSVSAFRKFFPRVQLGTDGSRVRDQFDRLVRLQRQRGHSTATPYILHGHECLVFFLGGIPLLDPATGTFGDDRLRQGSDESVHATCIRRQSTMYNANRQPPLFEFNAGRLFLDPQPASRALRASPATTTRSATRRRRRGASSTSISTPTSAPTATAVTTPTTSTSTRPMTAGNGPIGLNSYVHFPDSYGSSADGQCRDLAVAQSLHDARLTGAHQRDGHVPEAADVPDHLVGSRRALRGRRPVRPASTTSAATLPLDRSTPTTTRSTRTDASIRQREYDNLTNFKSGTLQ